MYPRSSILEPQQFQKIEERIDREASLVWANGRWVFKKRVFERGATLAPKVKSASSTINTSNSNPPTPRAPEPRTERAHSNPRSQHDDEAITTAARRRRRARSHSGRKSTLSTTAQSSTQKVSLPPPKGMIRPSTKLSEVVPKGPDRLRPALSKSLTAAEHKSTTDQVRTIRAAKATTTSKQSSPVVTRTSVLPKVALGPVSAKRVLEGGAILAPKVKSASSTINTSNSNPPTPRAPAPRTERARSNPRSQHDAITAAEHKTTTMIRPLTKLAEAVPKGPDPMRPALSKSLTAAEHKSTTRIRPSTKLTEAVPKGPDPTRPALSKFLTAAEHKSTTMIRPKLTEAVPKGPDPLRPTLSSKALTGAERKSTTYQVRTIRAAKATTTAKQSAPAVTRTSVFPKLALGSFPATSHISSFFDSNRSHLARAELAPTRPPIPSPELSFNPDPQPDTAQINLNPRPCASLTAQILHSQLAHLRTTWAHQRRLHLLHHLLHHSHYPLSTPHHAGRLLPEPPSSPPTLSSLACLSPRTQLQLPSSSTSFYKLSWAAYQKLYNTGVSGKTLSKAKSLFRACGREVFWQGVRTG